jgi:AmmeMemoRadiSam system protein A
MTSDADRILLLTLARGSIAAHVEGTPAPAPEITGVLARPGGAFVTLHARGELRGCIGHLETDEPLGRVVPRCAVAACSTDPRFPAVTRAEAPGIIIELSLLGELERIDGAVDVEVGRHGLVVKRGWHRGLLLPQVAVEWKWDREAFLSHTCRKAGLSPDAWQHGATLWRFEAEVFAEPGTRHE